MMGNQDKLLINWGQHFVRFYKTRIWGHYAPRILATAEGSFLEPCPHSTEGLTEVLRKDTLLTNKQILQVFKVD